MPYPARSIETELLPCCRKFGLSIVIYNPLAGGIFSGKYRLDALTSAPPDSGRYSDAATAIGSMYRSRYFKPEVFECLQLVEPVALKHGLSLLEIALRWVVHHSMLEVGGGGQGMGQGQDGVIIGVSSQAQLEGNLRDLEKRPLPEEVVQVLDRAWLVSKASTPTYWR